MSLWFDYEAPSGRIVFGAGRVADVPAEVERLGGERVVVVAAPEEETTEAPQ